VHIVVTVAVMLVVAVTPPDADEADEDWDTELEPTLVVEALTLVEVELEAGEEVETLEDVVVEETGTQPGIVKVPLPALPDPP
jgi:hypothetical protein